MKIPAFSILVLLTVRFGAQAQTLYWDTNGSAASTAATATANWNGTSDWTTSSTGSAATTSFVSGDSVIFSAGTAGTGVQSVAVNGGVTTAGITINNGAVNLSGAASPSLTIGSGGLTINSNDGATSIASSTPITLSANQSWANNSTQNFSDAGTITGTGVTLTFNGTGTGTSTLTGVISGTMGITDVGGGLVYLSPSGTDTYSGALSISISGEVVINSAGAAGGMIYLNGGGTLGASAGFTLSTNITLGAGGGKISGGVISGGSQIVGVDLFTNNSIIGHTGLTITGGDFLPTSSSFSDVGTLALTSVYANSGALGNAGSLATAPTRVLAFGAGIFGNGAAVNVGNNTILDFGYNYAGTNTIVFTSGSALEERSGGANTFSTANISLPTAGGFTIGNDDTATTGTITINGSWALSGPLTVYDNANPTITNGTAVNFANTISGSSSLTFASGPQRSGGYITLSGNNSSLTGPIYIDTGVVLDLTAVNAGGAAGNNIHIAGGTLALGFNNFPTGGLAANIVLDTPTGAGTQDTLTGVAGVDTFSGEILNGTASTLHVVSDNMSFAPTSSATVSNYTTLDVDANRLFISGPFGLNALPSGTGSSIKVAGVSGTGLDFNLATSAVQTFTVNVPITFGNGSLLETRANSNFAEKGTFTNVTLPSSGTFNLGSDDTVATTGSSITVTNAQSLTGNLQLNINEFGASAERVTFNGFTGNAGSLTVAAGVNNSTTNYGLLTLAGTNTYGGATTIAFGNVTISGNSSGTGTTYAVQNGTLNIVSGGSIPTAANVTLGNGTTSGTLVLGDSTGAVSQTIGGLVISGTGTTDAVVGGGSASVSTLTISNTSADTYAGTIGGPGTNQNAIALVKKGGGTLTLSNLNTYTGGTTVSAGRLAIDGSITGNAAVGLAAEIGGHGMIAGTISGAGAVGPGKSPGILTASAVNPGAGTSFNFEFTLAGSPTYSNAAASGDDVLHLESGTPFTSLLTSANVINLYFAAPNISYRGGFFINSSASTLAADLANATFNFYMEDDAKGTVTYNGVKYSLTKGTKSTIAVTNAAFADGTVNGATEIFTAPEPSTYALMMVGAAGLFFLQRRAVRKS